MLTVLRCLGTVAFVSPLIAAPTQAQMGPAQVVESAFAAIARHDWPTLASLVDLTALDSLRQESLGLLILVTEERKAGKEGGGYDPHEVVIADHLPGIGNERVSAFPGSPRIAELASLSSTEFFVRWCQAVYRRHTEQDPVQEFVELQRHIIGALLESDGLAHVLYRRESRHVEMSELFIDLPGRVTIMPLKRDHNAWRLLLNDDLGWTVDFMEILHSEPHYRPHHLKRTTRVAPTPTLLADAPMASAGPGPAETVRLAFAALQRRDWPTLTALVDSERLVAFQREELAYLIAWNNSRESRAQAAREGISAFILQYDDSLSPESVQPFADIRVPVFPHAPTIGDLWRLSPSAFFTRWCQAVYESDPDNGPGGDRVRIGRTVIGDVFEGQRLAHVLYRLDGASTRSWHVERMPLRQSVSGWRLLLNDDIGWSIDLAMLLDRPFK